MIGVVLLLAGAAVAFGMAKWLRLPAIPLLILAGVVLSRLGVVPADTLQDGLVLGLTFLVFVAGIELNPRRVGEYGRAAVRVGIAQFLLLGLAGFGVSLALGFAAQTSLYLALALTASSTLVVLRLLQRRGQLFEPFGRLVIGVLLLQDLLVILLIPVLTRLPDGVGSAAFGLLATLGLVALAYLCLRWVVPFTVLRLGLDNESVLLSVLALLFIFIGIANSLRLPLVAGAFLAGVALSSFPVSAVVRGQLNSISDFFLAIFFTSLGGFIALPTPTELVQAVVLAAVVITVTPPLVTYVAERAGLSARPAMESGLLLAQTSEFSLVVGLQGLVVAQIEPGVFTVIALVTVTTMILTPFVATDRMTWWLMRFHPLRRGLELRPTPSDHILLLGCGENGLPLLETLIGAGHEVFVIDDDPAIIQRLREGEVPCIRGDASDRPVLQSAGVDQARLVISTVRRPRDNENLLRRRPTGTVLVRVFEEQDAEWVRSLGGRPILYSEAAANEFMRDYERLLAAADPGNGKASRGSEPTGVPAPGREGAKGSPHADAVDGKD